MGRHPDRFRAAEAALWSSVDLAPTEEWISLRGGERVRVQIVGEGEPVLFVHGGSSSGANWAPLVARLAQLRCLVLDRPGCGLSDPVAGGAKLADIAQVESFADGFVVDVLDGLGIERARLVSTSFGGYFALRAAATHPMRVDRLVELGWPMGAPVDHAPFPMRVAALPGLGTLFAKVPPTRGGVVAMMKQVGLRGAFDSGRVSDEMLDWFLALLRDTDTVTNEIRANPKIVTPLRGINPDMVFRDDLMAGIDAPVLFIWGADDPMGGADVARQFTDRFRHATLELLTDVGHAPWIDDPDRCAELTVDFLTAGGG